MGRGVAFTQQAASAADDEMGFAQQGSHGTQAGPPPSSHLGLGGPGLWRSAVGRHLQHRRVLGEGDVAWRGRGRAGQEAMASVNISGMHLLATGGSGSGSSCAAQAAAVAFQRWPAHGPPGRRPPRTCALHDAAQRAGIVGIRVVGGAVALMGAEEHAEQARGLNISSGRACHERKLGLIQVHACGAAAALTRPPSPAHCPPCTPCTAARICRRRPAWGRPRCCRGRRWRRRRRPRSRRRPARLRCCRRGGSVGGRGGRAGVGSFEWRHGKGLRRGGKRAAIKTAG